MHVTTVNANGALGRRILARKRIMRWITVWMTKSTDPVPRVEIFVD